MVTVFAMSLSAAPVIFPLDPHESPVLLPVPVAPVAVGTDVLRFDWFQASGPEFPNRIGDGSVGGEQNLQAGGLELGKSSRADSPNRDRVDFQALEGGQGTAALGMV